MDEQVLEGDRAQVEPGVAGPQVSVSSWSTSRPLSMITTSSNSGLSSSIRWVEMTIVRGWAMKSASSSSWKAARDGASMPR